MQQWQTMQHCRGIPRYANILCADDATQMPCSRGKWGRIVTLCKENLVNSIHSFRGFRSLAGFLQAPTCVWSVTGPFAWLSGTQICARQAPRCVARCWLKLQVALVKRPRSESMSALRIFDAASSTKSNMGQSQRMRQVLIAVRDGRLKFAATLH